MRFSFPFSHDQLLVDCKLINFDKAIYLLPGREPTLIGTAAGAAEDRQTALDYIGCQLGIKEA